MSEKWDVLHSLQDYRISTHTKIVVGAPNLDFIGNLRGVGRRETGCKAVDVVEVTVRLVLVLLVELLLVELFVVEAAGRLRRLALLGCGSNGLLRGGRRLGLSLRLSGMEGTSPSLLGRLLLGGGGGGEVLSDARGVTGRLRVGAHLDGSVRGNGDALVLVDLLDVRLPGNARVACGELLAAHVERGPHDGALGRALGEGGDGGEAGGRGGAEGAQLGGLRALEERAERFEARQGRKPGHDGGREERLTVKSRVFLINGQVTVGHSGGRKSNRRNWLR